MDDFDAILDLDSHAVTVGAEAGRAAAAATSTRDGFALGYAKGGELAVEIGSYEGFLAVWESVLVLKPGAVQARTRKAIESLRSLVADFPRTHQAAAEMDFIGLVEKIRAKYRQICSGLPGEMPNLSPLSGGGHTGLSF